MYAIRSYYVASLPFILTNGHEAYTAYGTEKSPGTHLFGISGHVEKPGMYELPLGLPLLEVIDKVAGGVWKGRKLKGVIRITSYNVCYTKLLRAI